METAKALAALISATIMPTFVQFGIGPDTTVEQLIGIVAGIVAWFFTWLIPNKPKEV